MSMPRGGGGGVIQGNAIFADHSSNHNFFLSLTYFHFRHSHFQPFLRLCAISLLSLSFSLSFSLSPSLSLSPSHSGRSSWSSEKTRLTPCLTILPTRSKSTNAASLIYTVSTTTTARPDSGEDLSCRMQNLTVNQNASPVRKSVFLRFPHWRTVAQCHELQSYCKRKTWRSAMKQ